MYRLFMKVFYVTINYQRTESFKGGSRSMDTGDEARDDAALLFMMPPESTLMD